VTPEQVEEAARKCGIECVVRKSGPDDYLVTVSRGRTVTSRLYPAESDWNFVLKVVHIVHKYLGELPW